jgi:GntR family transcriptional regulator
MPTRRAEVAAMLERSMARGLLKPGQELPSEAELVQATGYSRTTIRQAMGDLARRGLVESSQGARRRVPQRVVLTIHVTRAQSRVAGSQSPTLGADSWAHDVAALGHQPAEQLTVRRETGWVIRELLRLVDGRPHNLATWWFPDAIAKFTALDRDDDIPSGSVPYLESIGCAPQSFTLLIEARMPRLGEQSRLALPAEVPLLEEARTGWNRQCGQVFRSVTLWPSGRARLKWDIG